MKNFQYFIPLFACLISLNACQKEEDTLLSKSNSEARTADEAIVSWQECYDFTNYDMTVCFSDANEYRCPCDVNCFWEGSVEYTLQVRSNDQETIITLQPPGNPTNAPSSAVVGKVKISIEEAQPVDCADYGKFEAYQLKITVSESDTNDLNDPKTPEERFLNKVLHQE